MYIHGINLILIFCKSEGSCTELIKAVNIDYLVSKSFIQHLNNFQLVQLKLIIFSKINNTNLTWSIIRYGNQSFLKWKLLILSITERNKIAKALSQRLQCPESRSWIFSPVNLEGEIRKLIWKSSWGRDHIKRQRENDDGIAGRRRWKKFSRPFHYPSYYRDIAAEKKFTSRESSRLNNGTGACPRLNSRISIAYPLDNGEGVEESEIGGKLTLARSRHRPGCRGRLHCWGWDSEPEGRRRQLCNNNKEPGVRAECGYFTGLLITQGWLFCKLLRGA